MRHKERRMNIEEQESRKDHGCCWVAQCLVERQEAMKAKAELLKQQQKSKEEGQAAREEREREGT